MENDKTKKFNSKACIIIPIYKKTPTKSEKYSICRTKENLKEYDIYFITFRELDLSEYKDCMPVKVFYFPKRFFESTRSYNRLMLSPFFYLRFICYQYMCIVQTDAVILGTGERLGEFIDLNYDYIGAPWKRAAWLHRFEPENHFWILELFPGVKRKLMGEGVWCLVGNGGLSLRNIRNTIKLLLKYWIFRISWYRNEDLFFAYYGNHKRSQYKLPPPDLASQFAVETTAKADMEKGMHPFGIHAWEKYVPNLMDNKKGFLYEEGSCFSCK